ncbi:MAG: Cof-type HAD-IIB family hydrolase [Oscillospiraceae bacterium]|nr:Cof-type HAD-IIB family hydrolase [Oscillospiraceae bacterium]
MNPKMILTDLDGTLICSDGSISERTKSILKSCQERGIYVVIATARYWIGAERYIEEIQPDYEITTDGTLIHRHGEQIYSCNLETEDTNQIIQDILAHDNTTEITVAAGRQVLWNSEHISESEKLHKAVYYDYKKPLSCQANKIVAELPDYETASEIANKNNCRLQSYRGENWYAFLPKMAGKIQAIQELAKLLNISLNEIAAFGDDKNDMEMLKMCGTGIAVSNAVSEVKDIADSIALSNDENGVAEWIAENVL